MYYTCILLFLNYLQSTIISSSWKKSKNDRQYLPITKRLAKTGRRGLPQKVGRNVDVHRYTGPNLGYLSSSSVHIVKTQSSNFVTSREEVGERWKTSTLGYTIRKTWYICCRCNMVCLVVVLPSLDPGVFWHTSVQWVSWTGGCRSDDILFVWNWYKFAELKKHYRNNIVESYIEFIMSLFLDLHF